MTALPTIASRSERFTRQVGRLFPPADESGLVLRPLLPPQGPMVTVAYLRGLIVPGDLERLVLTPVAAGLPNGGPAELAGSGHFPAPELRTATDLPALRSGLLAGLAAVHVEGHRGVLLVGSGAPATVAQTFAPGLESKLATIRGCLRAANLRLERLPDTGGTPVALAYLDGAPAPETLQAVRIWAPQLQPEKRRLQWWRAILEVLRLPPAVESSNPAAVAEALRRGYVAVVADHLPNPLLAPNTLELLLSGPQDSTLTPALRRLLPLPRALASLIILTVGAAFVAITSYHHSLLPGPFLMALASARRNMPFPIVLEVLLVELFRDAMWEGAIRIGGRRWIILAAFGTALGGLKMLEAGILAPGPVTVGLVGAGLMQVVSNSPLTRPLRSWRYLFIAAAAGLGIYGMALMAYLMMAYLAEEHCFGHPLRQPPPAAQGGTGRGA